MNTYEKKYIVEMLYNATIKLTNLTKQQEEMNFIPIGILLMKWIKDSQERYQWELPKDLLSFNFNLLREGISISFIEGIAKQLEDNNPILKGIFTSLCFSNITYVDRKNLEEIVGTYENFDFSNEDTEKEITGPFIRKFYQELQEQSIYYSFITPNSIVQLLSRLFDSYECNYVADITAGTCGILTEVINLARRSNKQIDKISFYAQEVDYKVALLGTINLLLHGVDKNNINVVIKDTLKESVLSNSNFCEGFDIILSNPPLGMRCDTYELGYSNEFVGNRPGKMYADWLFIQRGLASLKYKGKAAFIVSKGTLTRNSEKLIRKYFLDKDIIEAIISLPSNLYGSKTIPIEILIINLDKRIERRNRVLFIDASKDYYVKERGIHDIQSEEIEKILKTYHSWNEILDYSSVIDISEIEKQNYEMESSRYIKNKCLSLEPVSMIKLREVSEVRRGLQLNKKEISNLSSTNEGSHYYIKIGDINDGSIEFNEKIKGLSESKITSYELRPKDIIISSRGTLIKTAIYEDYMPPSIISANIMIIRVNKNYNPYFLKFYLDSAQGQELIQNIQGGSTITALNQSKLQELLVPDIEMDIQNNLADRIVANEINYKSIVEHAKKMYEQNIDIINKEISRII